ncbi:MAG: GNAT family N-acetyltransferase [bacterium]|nr:GNAT family N-acetyltransferase [bacterium]
MFRDNIITEIQEKDLEQLQKIMKQVFGSDTSDLKAQRFYKISKENRDIYVLGYYIQNCLVGTVTLNILTTPSGKEATIWNLAVLEEYRRLGIANKLMIKAEEIAKNYEDVCRVWLFSGVKRTAAHKLYKKLGYDSNIDKAFVKQIG